MEEEVTETQTDPDLTEVSLTLRELASTLVPPTLEERVLLNYPTPIALPYRRFLDSRFSIHEKVYGSRISLSLLASLFTT